MCPEHRERVTGAQPARLDMTALLPELSTFPAFGTFDGELVALDDQGEPDFPLLCERMLMRRRNIPVTYVLFDILSLNGRNLMDGHTASGGNNWRRST